MNRQWPLKAPLRYLVLISAYLTLSAWAHAEFVVEVTRGQTEAIPIAIVPFASPEVSAATFDVAQLVSDDLARSGRFNAMDRKDMIDQPHSGAAIGFDDWRRLNNDYIVVGPLQAQGPDRFNITYELYNVLTKQRLLGLQISANRPGLRLAGHQVADMPYSRRSSAYAARSPPASPIYRCSGICPTRPTS